MAEPIRSNYDGTISVWGAEIITDLSFEDLLGIFKSELKKQITDTMSYLEENYLFVHRILLIKEDHGWYVAVESYSSSKYAESHSCRDCHSLIQWEEPLKGHEKTCPFILVHSVMTE